ncbi:unnamed protein product [Aphanomyces euteiches]
MAARWQIKPIKPSQLAALTNHTPNADRRILTDGTQRDWTTTARRSLFNLRHAPPTMLVMTAPSSSPSPFPEDEKTTTTTPATKKWQSDDDAVVRRSVLLHILIVLKQKYGKVDQRISNIARRAELALYTRANSRDEYGNPHTLCKRLHALIVKLYAHQNEAAKKRKGCAAKDTEAPVCKRIKQTATTPVNADVLLDGQEGVLRTICSFLDIASLVAFSSTTHRARDFIPHCITTISLRASNLPCAAPAPWLARFPNVETLVLRGDNRFGFGEIAMENIDMRSNEAVEWLLAGVSGNSVRRLHTLALRHVYCDGLDDPLTTHVAGLVPQLPALRHLQLVGNCMTDVGAIHLSKLRTLETLNVDNNFIGERGGAALNAMASSGSCQLSMEGNLVARGSTPWM